MKRQKYVMHTRTLSVNGEYIQADCADITFINYGTVDLILNSVIRITAPVVGQFNWITIAANEGEIDSTKYEIKFSGVNGDAVALWREYID